MLWIITVTAFTKASKNVRHNRMLESGELVGILARAAGAEFRSPLPYTIVFVIGTVGLIVYYI